MPITRRRFHTIAGRAAASLACSSACDFSALVATTGRLGVRIKTASKTTASGESALGLGTPRDGILRLPTMVPATPMPLMVLLHGAGGSARRQLDRFGTVPDEAGVAVLALDSRGGTWDAIRTSFGGDVAFMDRALEHVMKTVAIDPQRVSIGGFSDGATYALSLGLINGDLFRRIVAFSPGFVIPAEPTGRPRVFVSHGRADEILPIDRCSRVIVPGLKKRGHDVTFREFDGGHTVPPEIAVEGFKFAASK